MKIRCILPTRSRPSRALSTMDGWNRLANSPHQIEWVLVVNSDDQSMFSPIIQHELKRRQHTLHVIHGPSTKIEAINAGPVGDADIIILAADDMEARHRGWDHTIREHMSHYFPNRDGALWYNDGHTGDSLCTLPILGINYYRKFGYIYHPDYKSLWCDNEYGEVSGLLRRVVYFPDVIIEHCHPAFGKNKRDALLAHTESFFHVDEATYRRRKADNYGLGMTPVKFSIGIASLRKRQEHRARLLDCLNSQINALARPLDVEIVLDIDGGERSVGLKRDAIVKRAVGEYIAFIDDDDRIPPYYVQAVLDAIQTNPDVVGIRGEYRKNGGGAETFIHAMGNGPAWRTVNGIYLRGPNHLNPIRRQFAEATGYRDMKHGEDRDFAERVFGMLKTEVMIDRVMYHYDFKNDKGSVN